jgi:hypothetical protein
LSYLICTVVTLDTLGAVASNGGQGFTWLLFLAVFFFLPYSILFLGRPARQEVAIEQVSAAFGPADVAESAT